MSVKRGLKGALLATNIRSGQTNNFDCLRVMGALAVFVSHILLLYANDSRYSMLGAFGIAIFFSVSGYLVASSWDRDPNFIRFMIRRILRIFPGLVFALAVGAFVVGPLLTRFPLEDYFTNTLFGTYCKSVFLYPMSFELPGVFRSNPFKNVVNGSLWTLSLEVFVYVVFALCSVSIWRNPRFRLSAVLIILGGLYGAEWGRVQGTFLTMDIASLRRCAACFLGGVLLWELRDRLPVYRWIWIPLCYAMVASQGTGQEMFIFMIFTPIAAISFATGQYPFFKSFARFGDASYGIYIYSFLIQQVVMSLYPTISLLNFVISTALVSAVAACLSWHLVEKQALSFKHLL